MLLHEPYFRFDPIETEPGIGIIDAITEHDIYGGVMSPSCRESESLSEIHARLTGC